MSRNNYSNNDNNNYQPYLRKCQLEKLEEDKFLNLGNQRPCIGDRDCEHLKNELKFNTSLQKLIIDNNNIGSEGCKHLSELIVINHSLRKLNLINNKIGDEGCKYLCEALEADTFLQVIYLGSNQIGVTGCKYLSEALQINHSLQRLDLGNNKIGTEGFRYLIEALYINNSLQTLDIKWNKIGNEGCKYLSDVLKVNNSLQKLNLGNNNIGDEGCKYLCEGLKINNSLQKIDLGFNNIGKEGSNQLVELMKVNNSIQFLKLSNNTLVDEKSFVKINSRIETNKQNSFSIKRAANWFNPEEINKKPDLKLIMIKDCRLKEFKIELNNFSHLINLDLRYNELNSETIKCLCKFLKWNSSLKILNLQGNKTIGDREGEELLSSLVFNVSLIECKLNETSVSTRVQKEIKGSLIGNNLLGRTSLNKICLKHSEISELIISNKISEAKEKLNSNINNTQILQEILFICCVWNKFELCEYILIKYNLNINFKLEDENTYLHLSVMKDKYDVSVILIEKGIDINILNNEKKSCKDLCISNGKCKSLFEDIKQLKVVVLGKAAVGKTTLVNRILKHKEDVWNQIYSKFFQSEKDPRTDGIEMHEWQTGINYNNIIQLWDFGGQALFYMTHQFFLSKNSIHLLLFDLTDKLMEKELFFWLNSIQYRAPKSKVIIVGTYMDKIDPKSMKEEINVTSNKIKSIYDKMISTIFEKSNNSTRIDNKIEIIPCFYWENPRLRQSFSEEIWFYPINGKEKWNIKYLEETIRKFSFNTIVRKEFIELRDKIISIRNAKLDSGKNPILLREELESMILECFDNRNEEISRNMNLLHELGFILDYKNNYKYIIIYPQWLATVFKSVISLKNTNQIKDGMIQLRDIIQNLNGLLKLNQEEKKRKNSYQTVRFCPSNLENNYSSPDEDFKLHNEFLIELMEEFNIITPHPNESSEMKKLKESNEKDKYTKVNLNMIISCLLNTPKPNDIEELIFNLKDNSNNGKEILGRKYYFSFIPIGIYEKLFNNICKSIGSTMRFWKNGFIVTSKDTYLTLEIIGDENNLIFIKSIGSLNCKFIASFHFIIEALFKTEYPLLWNNVKIDVSMKKIYLHQEEEFTSNYLDCLNKFNLKEEISFNNKFEISYEKLIPEKFEDKNNNDIHKEENKAKDPLKIDSSQFIQIRKIGTGKYADVFICNSLENNGKYVIKCFKVYEGHLEMNKKIKESFERELEIMKKSTHSNLTKLIGYEDSIDKLRLVINLFDYSLKNLQDEWLNRLPSTLQQETQRDPLDDRIRKVEEYWWKEEEMIFISLQISNGLEYLHNQLFISHLDIKAENIFIDLKDGFEYGKRPSLFSIHIGDFGVSRQFTNTNSTLHEFLGSREHMAPEVKKNQNPKKDKNFEYVPYNPFKADIYSLGVLFCEIIGNDTSLQFNLGRLKGKTKLEKIIRNCLQEDPSKRHNISEIATQLKNK